MARARDYRIVVRGEFGELLSNAFEGLSIDSRDGQTVLCTGPIDKAAFHGLLDRLGDLGLDIVSLQQCVAPGGECPKDSGSTGR